jgi:hypothetical protein
MTEPTPASGTSPVSPDGDGQKPPPHDLKWYERPDIGNLLAVGLLVGGVILVGLGFVFHGDSKLAIKKLPGFYALTAIVSVILAALAARLLRGLFHVGEDYYDR